jgi:hypothetical protein
MGGKGWEGAVVGGCLGRCTLCLAVLPIIYLSVWLTAGCLG